MENFFFFTHEISPHPRPTPRTHDRPYYPRHLPTLPVAYGGKERTAKRAVTLLCDKRDESITCVLRRDLQFTLMFSGHLLKDLFKGRRSFKQNY